MRPTTVPRSSGGPAAAAAVTAAPAAPDQAAPPPAEPPAGAVPRPRGPLPALAGGIAAGLGGRLRGRFRLPGRHDPAPHPGRLFGVCGWAAGLGLLGLPVAGRSSVAIITHAAPAWFEPTVVAVGLLGMVLTVGAFAAIHRPLCWHLLLAATGLLAVNLQLTLIL